MRTRLRRGGGRPGQRHSAGNPLGGCSRRLGLSDLRGTEEFFQIDGIVRIQASGAKAMTFRPAVLVADAGRELRWLGRVLLPGLFDGEHRFAIQPLADGKVLFQHSESFTGVLVPLFRNSLERDTKRGFEEMNRALKARAEA